MSDSVFTPEETQGIVNRLLGFVTASRPAPRERRYEIVCNVDGTSGFDVIDEDGRRAGQLTWDEMLGQVVHLTHPKLDHSPRYEMLTPWDEALRNANRATRRAVFAAEDAGQRAREDVPPLPF